MNLIGRENVASVKAEQFAERFALSQVVGKTCIIGDDSQVSYLDNAGNYFSVVTGDPVPIEAKGNNQLWQYLTSWSFSPLTSYLSSETSQRNL